MYEKIKSLRPYFFSLREIDKNVSLDLKIPSHWEYESVLKQDATIGIKVQDKNEKSTLLSLISTATSEGYDLVFLQAKDIIKKNREEEEKARLFKEKISELEKIFNNSSLDDLKVLSFNSAIKLLNIANDEETRDNSGRIGLAGEVNKEG